MRRNVIRTMAAGSVLLGTLCSVRGEEPAKVEDFFPPQVKVTVKRKLLEADKEAQLKKQGISQSVIDLYGSVFVDGYESNHLRWGDLKLDDLGPANVRYDTTGMREFPPLPKTGHPRMFFADAEREEHRHRLENTEAGKVAKKIIDCYVACLKGTLDPDADYLKPDILQGSFGTRGFMPLFRYGDRSGEGYRNHIEGKPEGQLNIGGLALEAYRCWVWEDKDAARLAAKAFETFLHDSIARTEQGKRHIHPSVYVHWSDESGDGRGEV